MPFFCVGRRLAILRDVADLSAFLWASTPLSIPSETDASTSILTDPRTDVLFGQHRWYAVTWGPTLFRTWAVTCAWGRLGTDWSQRQVREFETQDEATAEANAQVRLREKRGYTAVAW
jgi:predicted DNA-binding WGR domain protein